MLTALIVRAVATAIASLHSDIHRHFSELKGLIMANQQDVDALTAAISAMSDKFDTFSTGLDGLVADSAEIKSDLDALVALANQPSVDVTRLQSAVASLQSKQDAFQSRFTSAVADVHTDAGVFTPDVPTTPTDGGTPNA